MFKSWFIFNYDVHVLCMFWIHVCDFLFKFWIQSEKKIRFSILFLFLLLLLCYFYPLYIENHISYTISIARIFLPHRCFLKAIVGKIACDSQIQWEKIFFCFLYHLYNFFVTKNWYYKWIRLYRESMFKWMILFECIALMWLSMCIRCIKART